MFVQHGVKRACRNPEFAHRSQQTNCPHDDAKVRTQRHFCQNASGRRQNFLHTLTRKRRSSLNQNGFFWIWKNIYDLTIIGGREVGVRTRAVFYYKRMGVLERKRSCPPMSRLRDFPSRLHRTNRSENVVLHKLFVPSFDFYDFLNELLSELTPPFNVIIDCSFLIKKPINDEYRYVFAQRSTSFEIVRVIKNDSDIEKVLAFFKNKTNFELLNCASDNHRRQSAYDESGFNATKLVCACLFLSKISSLHAPIPFQ